MGQKKDVTPVFIVEDHKVMRATLGNLIDQTPGLILCGEAESAESALKQIPALRPRLVLIDISLPRIDGIELIRRLNEQDPDMLLVAISGYDETAYVHAAMDAGARGYVTKGDLFTLIDAIRYVLRGNTYTP